PEDGRAELSLELPADLLGGAEELRGDIGDDGADGVGEGDFADDLGELLGLLAVERGVAGDLELEADGAALEVAGALHGPLEGADVAADDGLGVLVVV